MAPASAWAQFDRPAVDVKAWVPVKLSKGPTLGEMEPPRHLFRAGFGRSLAHPAALTFFESHDCLARVLSVSDLVSSMPGTVSSKTGCRGREESGRHDYTAQPPQGHADCTALTASLGGLLKP